MVEKRSFSLRPVDFAEGNDTGVPARFFDFLPFFFDFFVGREER